MTEQEFIDYIDCNFPYNDQEKCIGLIEMSLAISPNSVFAVVEEICRLPQSQKNEVSVATQTELLNIVDSRFNHPAKEIVFHAARSLIGREELAVDGVIENLKLLEQFPGLFHARNILYFSCDDPEGKLESNNKP